MDDVERMYRQLVRTIRASFPQYLTQPFDVGELSQTILPYRLHRRELGLETNQDYELALMELLTGVRGYLVVDEKMRDVLGTELASPSPDTARIRDFAAAHVSLAPDGLQMIEGSPGAEPRTSSGAAPRPMFRSSGQASAASRLAPATSSAASAATAEPVRRVNKPITVKEEGEDCAFCKGALPAGRQISFCPHCGQDLTVVHCPACASELERGWKFCVTCGRSADTPSVR